jgi:hypothetical protein
LMASGDPGRGFADLLCWRAIPAILRAGLGRLRLR